MEIYISSDDILAALPLFFIICAGIMLICYLIIRSAEAKNKALPVQEVNAKIIDLRQESTMGIIAVTWILFVLADGSRVRLVTDIKNDYMVGDEGVLKYQGERLISFERGKVKETETKDLNRKKQPVPKIKVTQAEIEYIMQKKNIPYADAAILAREIKMKRLEQKGELE